MVKDICELIEVKNFSDPIKVFLLNSLDTYMKFNKTVIKANQTIIINNFGMYNGILYLLNDKKEFDQFITENHEIAE